MAALVVSYGCLSAVSLIVVKAALLGRWGAICHPWCGGLREGRQARGIAHANSKMETSVPSSPQRE